MKTAEDITGDHYYRYKNAAGEFINSHSTDQVVKDSVNFDVGWLRRPSDRRITFGMYFSDYLATNKNFKAYLNLLYGSNMPYNIPNAVRYRNAAVIEPYIRCDIGFSALLMDDDRSNALKPISQRIYGSITAALRYRTALGILYGILLPYNRLRYILIFLLFAK